MYHKSGIDLFGAIRAAKHYMYTTDAPLLSRDKRPKPAGRMSTKEPGDILSRTAATGRKLPRYGIQINGDYVTLRLIVRVLQCAIILYRAVDLSSADRSLPMFKIKGHLDPFRNARVAAAFEGSLTRSDRRQF